MLLFRKERDYELQIRSPISYHIYTYIHTYTYTNVKIFSFSIYEIGRTDRARRFHRGKLCGSYVLCRRCKLSDGNACFFSGVVDGEIDGASIFRRGLGNVDENLFFASSSIALEIPVALFGLCALKKCPFSLYYIIIS